MALLVTPLSSTSQGQSELQDLDQGASAVFSVFTNASCMLYTIKQGFSEASHPFFHSLCAKLC